LVENVVGDERGGSVEEPQAAAAPGRRRLGLAAAVTLGSRLAQDAAAPGPRLAQGRGRRRGIWPGRRVGSRPVEGLRRG
jgi:hypothetical protein